MISSSALMKVFKLIDFVFYLKGFTRPLFRGQRAEPKKESLIYIHFGKPDMYFLYNF